MYQSQTDLNVMLDYSGESTNYERIETAVIRN
jgi:hypothetical protein